MDIIYAKETKYKKQIRKKKRTKGKKNKKLLILRMLIIHSSCLRQKNNYFIDLYFII